MPSLLATAPGVRYSYLLDAASSVLLTHLNNTIPVPLWLLVSDMFDIAVPLISSVSGLK